MKQKANGSAENDVISMLELLIDNIFVEFGGHIFQQIIGISMCLSPCKDKT